MLFGIIVLLLYRHFAWYFRGESHPLENQKATNPSFYTYLRDWQFPWADFMLRQMQVGSLGAVAEFRDDVPEQWEAGSVKGAGNTVFCSIG